MSKTSSNNDDTQQIPAIVRACVLFRAISLPGSFFVTVLYWTLVFNGAVKVISVFTHGVTFLVMMFDTLLSRQPFRMSHWFYFQIYTMIYVLWSIVFHVAEIDRPCDCSEDDDEQSKYGCDEQGTKDHADECRFIYGSLNWMAAARVSTAVLVVVLLLVATPICYMIFYWVVIGLRQMTLKADNTTSAEAEATRARQDTLDHIDSKGCGNACCYEMKCSRLSLSDENWVDNFRRSSFKGVSDSTYLFIRGFWFLFMLSTLISGLATFPINLNFYLIFVTNWTLVVEVAYLMCAFASTYLAQNAYAASINTSNASAEDSL